jgi:two-component system, LuxR family, response regulator FixJ
MGEYSSSFWIVDDDLSFGRSLQRMLKALGLYAEYFGSAQSFLDSVLPEQRGCAIVHIHMPLCDGFGLMEKMRDLHYAMPVILITGRSDPEARDLAIRRGASGYLNKPFSGESLLELVRKLELDQAAS